MRFGHPSADYMVSLVLFDCCCATEVFWHRVAFNVSLLTPLRFHEPYQRYGSPAIVIISPMTYARRSIQPPLEPGTNPLILQYVLVSSLAY